LAQSLAQGLSRRSNERRDLADYNFSHASSLDVGMGSDERLLFADNSSCALQPETTQGPYWIDSEVIRRNMTDGQAGVPLYLDIQLLDTSTCEPVPATFVDVWHCNSTGVYSGVIADSNGNPNDTTNTETTFGRGAALTDVNGVVQFDTIFPGHYTGRAVHIHVLTHNQQSTRIRTNGTLTAGGDNSTFVSQASHVGQIFFDQDLISKVEETAPYNTNTQVLQYNSEDGILSTEADGSDPFVQYVLLGDRIEDGVLAWISLGIDPSADIATPTVGTWTAEGVVKNEGFKYNGPKSGPMSPSDASTPESSP
jgi:protocatechuate 3,4-dioxygenase beta subunit